MGGKIYTVLGAWYHATKHALEGWSDSLRLEVEPFGIRVVIIEPGLIETGFGDAGQQGLMERSKNGPYEQIASGVVKSMRTSYGQNRGTSPDVIAETVSKAVASSHPKTRYAVGAYAKPMIWMRQWLGDRLFDRIIKSQM
jgi:short-subunit dehydrogenase